MTATRQEAIRNAQRSSTYPVGMCARWTREQYGLPALGDFDGDGDADAVDMWAAARVRHPGDRNPPPGVPVFWAGGRKGHGHVGIAFPERRVRGTDWPAAGLVGTTAIADIDRVWGMTYLGWSEDLYGNEIPVLAPPRVGPSVSAVNRAIKAVTTARFGGRIADRLKKIRRDLRAKKRGS